MKRAMEGIVLVDVRGRCCLSIVLCWKRFGESVVVGEREGYDTTGILYTIYYILDYTMGYTRN